MADLGKISEQHLRPTETSDNNSPVTTNHTETNPQSRVADSDDNGAPQSAQRSVFDFSATIPEARRTGQPAFVTGMDEIEPYLQILEQDLHSETSLHAMEKILIENIEKLKSKLSQDSENRDEQIKALDSIIEEVKALAKEGRLTPQNIANLSMSIASEGTGIAPKFYPACFVDWAFKELVVHDEERYALTALPLFGESAIFGLQTYNKIFCHGGHLLGVPYESVTVHNRDQSPSDSLQHDIEHLDLWLSKPENCEDDADYFVFVLAIRNLATKIYRHSLTMDREEDFLKAQLALFILTHEFISHNFTAELGSERHLFTHLITHLNDEVNHRYMGGIEKRYYHGEIYMKVLQKTNYQEKYFTVTRIEDSDDRKPISVIYKLRGSQEEKSIDLPQDQKYNPEHCMQKMDRYQSDKDLMELLVLAGYQDIEKDESEEDTDFDLRRKQLFADNLKDLFSWFNGQFRDIFDEA
jgi:hypothetical protein